MRMPASVGNGGPPNLARKTKVRLEGPMIKRLEESELFLEIGIEAGQNEHRVFVP